MKGPKRRKFLVCPALRIQQHPDHPLYVFALTGEQLWNIASIDHISRTDSGKLIGYQRGAIKRHVRGIVEYLNSGSVLLPNSLIVALRSSVRFRRGSGTGKSATSAGTLRIPLPMNGDAKPGWIVDGQQRAVALSLARRRDLLVPINAFVADDVSVQREQFFASTASSRCREDLATELLPEIDSVLPQHLAKAASTVGPLRHAEPRSGIALPWHDSSGVPAATGGLSDGVGHDPRAGVAG